MRDRPPLLAWCRGRWPAILVALGVPAKLLNRRNQPCPWCGGKDRFRFGAHEDGLWICNVCGGGNGIGFLKRFLKTDFKGVAEAIEGAIGVGVAAQEGDQGGEGHGAGDGGGGFATKEALNVPSALMSVRFTRSTPLTVRAGMFRSRVAT